MRRFTTRERLRYAFDNSLSRGPMGLVLWLALVTAAIILTVSALVFLVATEGDRQLFEHSFVRLAWMGFLQTLGTGSMGDVGSLQYLAAMMVVTLAGIFLLSTLIGLITSAIEARLAQLRKGRSRVVETGHTVILGWNEQVFTFVAELVEANANRRRRRIAILAPRDKVEMEDAIDAAVAELRGTRVVCRTGNPMDPGDLGIVNIDAARAVLILAGAGGDPDAEVIKTLLAIAHATAAGERPLHIVAEIRDPANAGAARLASRGQVELVLAGELISRMIAQTCRQAGLSQVYSELLDFAGQEIYFHAEPGLAGQTFGDLLGRFEAAALIGLARDGRPKLLPHLDTVVGPDDALVVIAPDDRLARLAAMAPGAVDVGAIAVRPPAAPAPRQTLILGWSWRGPDVIRKLDRYAAPGSTVTVVAGDERPAADVALHCRGLRHQTVTCAVADITRHEALAALDPARFQHIVVLACADDQPAEQADARTMVTLLHLRDLLDRAAARPTVVSEMLDLRNRRLAEVTRADDFIVSDQLVSLLMTQIAESRALAAVFADLLGVEGAEVYLKPVTDYLVLARPVTFHTVVEAARRRGEIAIGYRRAHDAADPGAGHGVTLNPAKATTVSFRAGDCLIVLAES